MNVSPAATRKVFDRRFYTSAASLSILGAAIGRLPIDAIKNAGPLAFFGISDLIILTCLAIDTVKHRKLHPAFAVAALIVIVSQPLRFLLASTPLWMKFATWVTQ